MSNYIRRPSMSMSDGVSESKFWLILWAMIFVTLLGSTSIVASCVQQNNAQEIAAIDKYIAKGIDPIKARCAVRGEAQGSVICALATVK